MIDWATFMQYPHGYTWVHDAVPQSVSILTRHIILHPNMFLEHINKFLTLLPIVVAVCDVLDKMVLRVFGWPFVYILQMVLFEWPPILLWHNPLHMVLCHSSE